MSDKPDFADSLLAQMIADYVAGGMTLIDACKTVGHAHSTIYVRINESERFAAMMERARESGYDAIANQCLAIADDGTNDYVEKEGKNGATYIGLDRDHIQRSKLRVETRLKLLAKWHPKKYGEKIQIESKTASVAIPTSDDPIEAQRAYEILMKGS